MTRKPYPSDLSDIEWLMLQPLIPVAKTGGRPRSVDIRDILNAMFYILRSGCAWQLGIPQKIIYPKHTAVRAELVEA